MSFAEIKKKVLERTPYLKQTLEHKGDTTLLNYFEESLQFSNPIPSERQEELLQVVKEMIENVISHEIAHHAIEQLRKHYYVSTADHHGPITHPFFVNSHLAQSLANQKHQLKNIFVFSCGGVSLNNSSVPRGILFHDAELNKKQFNLVSLKHRHHPVFSFPAYTKKDDTINPSKITLPKKLAELITELYSNETIFTYSTYSDQITYSNYLLWKKIPGQQNMNLIYLEQEKIVNELLLRYHLDNQTFLTHLLTDESVLHIFEECFDGIQGAFSSKIHTGTILFWAIHKGKRIQLKREGTVLTSPDGSYKVSLTPQEIKTAIKKGELMPSMVLSFIILSFYYGLTCGGGFMQVNYLTQMKMAYAQFLKLVNKEKEEKFVSSIITDYFCSDLVFATMENKKTATHASSIDLIIHQKTDTGIRLQELTEVCTLGQAVDHMIPELYRILIKTYPIIEGDSKKTNIAPVIDMS
ncbi:MAG TPA: hypothetical protein PK295_00815 [Candidatus Magasanikbacteria bacterium]|nr:hypothetical protein [Candidatus Magasanikbacteria bacterium]